MAIATAPGKGGIGVVRVSGRNIAPIIVGVIGRIPEPRRAIQAAFLDAVGQTLDLGLAIFFKGPASFTGEDTLELHGHGGPVVLQMILGRCLELGARPARPGEFSERSFLNDKMDLAQAEAVADLIDSATSVSARCAIRSLQGEFSKQINSLVAQLIEIRMLVEAALDFPEEELESTSKEEVVTRLAEVKQCIRQVLEQSRHGEILRSGLNVVIAGRPNMGKSSLLNALAQQDVALVTPIPGTTRDAIRQTIQVEGVPIYIVDTAGIRHSTDEIETLGIGRTWEMISRADLVLLVVEASNGVQIEDREILASFPENISRIVVYNKLDLIDGYHPRGNEGGSETIYLSARTGLGMDLLRSALLRVAGWQPGSEDVFMARSRHIAALTKALRYLHDAEAVVSRAELFAEDLRLAQSELNTITGEFVADDLLGEIFSRFCIGK